MSASGGARVRLLLDHRRNADVLRRWLESTDAFEVMDGSAGESELLVVDAAAVARDPGLLERARADARPLYLPCLLVASPRDVARLQPATLRAADEVLATPIRAAELRLRLERLLALRDQWLQLTRSIEELRRSNVDLEQFAYIAAHELSTPLTVVTGAVETIAARHRAAVDPAIRPLLDAAEEQSRRLQQLIHDLLAFSQAGRERPPGTADLDAVAREAVASLEAQVAAAGAAVDVDRLPTVAGDGAQLRVVLTNLIGNALKYRSGEPPRIRVVCDESEEGWRVSVIDNGRGIEPERLPTIFEMFDRGAAGPVGGYGIGLALCRRIVQRHGGEIWVEAAPGGGSVFRFTLPRR